MYTFFYNLKKIDIYNVKTKYSMLIVINSTKLIRLINLTHHAYYRNLIITKLLWLKFTQNYLTGISRLTMLWVCEPILVTPWKTKG